MSSRMDTPWVGAKAFNTSTVEQALNSTSVTTAANIRVHIIPELTHGRAGRINRQGASIRQLFRSRRFPLRFHELKLLARDLKLIGRTFFGIARLDAPPAFLRRGGGHMERARQL